MNANPAPGLEHVLSSQDMVGEAPLWSAHEQALYWVDILGCRFHRYHRLSGAWDTYRLDSTVGALGLCASGRLVLATGKGFALYELQNRTITWLSQPVFDADRMRFNDGKVDRQGRFWAGTMSLYPADWPLLQGTLYRLDADARAYQMDTGFALINGLDWSPDDTRMYVVDSEQRVVYLYDFDADEGSIGNRRVFLHTAQEPGVPDGLTVDAEGGVWVAYWDGWKIVRYDAAGNKVAQIDLPVQCPTSCTFGGSGLDELYITTAWEELSEEQRTTQPLAGDLFRARPGVRGKPSAFFIG